MKNKLFAMLLVLALVLSLMAGCASKTTEETSQPEASQPETTQEAPQEEAPAPEEAEDAETQEEEPAVEEVPEEPKFVVEYPIGDGETDKLTMWASFDVNAFGNYYSSFNDKPTVKYVQEKTGILLEFQEVSSTVATEQFNLMIAAGDYTDFLSCGSANGNAGGPGGGGNYTGGMAQAYVDEVIIDLSDMVEEHAPDFWAELMTYGADGIAGATTDGRFLNLASFTKSSMSDSGMWTRGDWLEKNGKELPNTFAEMIDLAYFYKETYGCTHTIPVGPGCSIDFANTAYGTGIFGVSGSDIAMFRNGDTLVSGMTTDGYREYLELMAQLYADGILNKEFYVSEMGRNESMSTIGKGNAAFWQGMADHKSEFSTMADDPDFEAVALPLLVGESGTHDFATPVDPVGGGGPSISVDCEDPELALEFLNWFYTEEGYMFANYGTEGETYNIGADGKVEYTDLILNNPNGMNSQQAFMYYAWSHTGSISYGDKNLDTYSDDIRQVISTWSDESRKSYDHAIPSAAALDAEETNTVTGMIADVTSYASEIILGWITGTSPLTDEAWDAYVDQCNQLGLEDCVAVYQGAYDDYLAEKG